MNLEHIEQLSKCPYGRHFLSKSYSIELLLTLLKESQLDGIENVLSSLKSTTPKLPAFLTYLSLLEQKKCIERIESNTKGSKRTLRLTNECETAIRKIIF